MMDVIVGPFGYPYDTVWLLAGSCVEANDETFKCILGEKKYDMFPGDVLLSDLKEQVKIYRKGSFENLFYHLYGE